MDVQRALLSGNRLHLQHGPIDLIIGAEGAREDAYDLAEKRLSTVLQELMDEIELLKLCAGPMPKGEVARKMWHAAQAHDTFVTPMAAVAGAVAETVLEAMRRGADLRRAYVNNGGDIALHLSRDTTFEIAMAGIGGTALGHVSLHAGSPVRGIATSGQGGRSLSFGIADSVTVLANSASAADIAATLIAGAVDLPAHPAIERKPAREVRHDSDLGSRLVVSKVGVLSANDVNQALSAGAKHAQAMQSSGLIHAASLHLRGQDQQIEMNKEKVLEHA